VERRGDQLLFVAPIFGLPLCAAAYFLVPDTPIPAAVLLVALLGALGYLWRGQRRLRAQPAALIRATVKKKRVHQTTDRATRKESRWYSFVLEVEHGSGLSREGSVTMRPSWLDAEPRLSVTQEIYEHCQEGEKIVAVAMPHDRGIYALLDSSGELFPGTGTKAVVRQ
jgi:hypothetical protein